MENRPDQILSEGAFSVTSADQPPPVSVVITGMPEQPSKPLFKDSARLLSISAFLFSLITGIFAMYQTHQNWQDTTTDSVNKLIDQYYIGQEKLSKLDPINDVAQANFLKALLRGVGTRAVSQAIQVQAKIDDGTWLALAQINDNENNLTTAEQA